jgi:TrkA domain protein
VTEIESTHLPGVGDRRDFTTEGGDRIGIVTFMDGRRKLVVYDREDPDRCQAVVELGEDDVRQLIELSGAA